MDKAQWKTVIEGQICFEPEFANSFQTTIMILSEILEERDRVYQAYYEAGAKPVVEFTQDRGAVNLKQNPLLRQWNELNTTALSYMRDLGITPAGLRKIQGSLPKQSPSAKFSKLAEFEREFDNSPGVVDWDLITKETPEKPKRARKSK